MVWPEVAMVWDLNLRALIRIRLCCDLNFVDILNLRTVITTG